MLSTRAFVRKYPVAAAIFFFLAAVLGTWLALLCYAAYSFFTVSSCTFEQKNSIVVSGIDIEVGYEDCMGLIVTQTFLAVRAFDPRDHRPTEIFRCDCGPIEIEPVDARTIRLVLPMERASPDDRPSEPPYDLLQPHWRGLTFTFVVRDDGYKRGPPGRPNP